MPCSNRENLSYVGRIQEPNKVSCLRRAIKEFTSNKKVMSQDDDDGGDKEVDLGQ